jgi:hypothetical protein
MIYTHVLNRGRWVFAALPIFCNTRTLIGGPAHQTWNASDLCELLVIASDFTGA